MSECKENIPENIPTEVFSNTKENLSNLPNQYKNTLLVVNTKLPQIIYDAPPEAPVPPLVPLRTINVTKIPTYITGKCHQCNMDQHCKYMLTVEKHEIFLCTDSCFLSFQALNKSYRFNFIAGVRNVPIYQRTCTVCSVTLPGVTNMISWQTMEFCGEVCLERYQESLVHCSACGSIVSLHALGKYCIRIGYEICQFCNNRCLEMYKFGKRFCGFCQKVLDGTEEICRGEGERIFCGKKCARFDSSGGKRIMLAGNCSECGVRNHLVLDLEWDGVRLKFCCENCFYLYQKNKNIQPLFCFKCKIFFVKASPFEMSIFHDGQVLHFCDEICKNAHILHTSEYISCLWCKTKKRNYDMIRKNSHKTVHACSLRCLRMYQHAYKITLSPALKCQLCLAERPPQFYIQREQTLISLCSKQCVERYRKFSDTHQVYNVEQIRNMLGIKPPDNRRSFRWTIEVDGPKPVMKNKATSCKPIVFDKELQTSHETDSKSIQTDDVPKRTKLVALPIPIYVPSPTVLFRLPIPYPVTFPFPFPVPVIIPLTTPSYNALRAEYNVNETAMITDPFQLDLLEIAEAVADNVDTETVAENNFVLGTNELVICEEFPGEYAHVPELPRRCEDAGGLNWSYGVSEWQKWCRAWPETDTVLQERRFEVWKLTVTELDYFLSRFIKEVRKPNGHEYSPDIIYYLCLCLQKFLQKNNRPDIIFNDTFYKTFNTSFNDLSKKFIRNIHTTNMIVTRVIEDYLWETQQLGTATPTVLINTLVYFNTKFFFLKSIEKHVELSFADIMKQWRKHGDGKKRQSLRYYPRLRAGDGDKNRCKKFHDAPENMDDQSRCPIRVFDFYLSKCPEVVKKSCEVFYLEPERSCIPDSPVWFSSKPLEEKVIENIFNRYWMVKEIGISLFSKGD